MVRSVAICATILFVAVAVPAPAQMGFRTPEMHGVWNPVVGAGGVYQIEGGGDKKSEMERPRRSRARRRSSTPRR